MKLQSVGGSHPATPQLQSAYGLGVATRREATTLQFVKTACDPPANETEGQKASPQE